MLPAAVVSDEEQTAAENHRMFRLTLATYEKMMEDSEVDPQSGHHIWAGKQQDLFEEVGAHVPEQSYVKRLLSMMDCAHQLQRGNRGRVSKWVLVQEPKPEVFHRFKDKVAVMRGSQGRVNKLESVRRDQSDTNNRLLAVERVLGNVMERLEILEEDYDARQEA